MRIESNSILVSIITPSYNQGRFVEETILSVLNQSYSNIEYIFVDGESTDSTMSIVEKYQDYIDIIIHEKDNGQSDAINKGFKIAKGDLVGWINSDDILYPDCVEKIVQMYFQNPNGAIYYHSFIDHIDSSGKIIGNGICLIPDRDYLLKYNYNVVQPGSFYRKDFVIKAGFLDQEDNYCMDLNLWLKLLKSGPIIGSSNEPYSAFRRYPGTKTDIGEAYFLKNIYKVLRKHGAKLYDRTIYYMVFYFQLKVALKSVLRKFIP